MTQRRCYSIIAILDFSLCGALWGYVGLPCIWKMLSYVHNQTYKPMICSSPSSPLRVTIEIVVSIFNTFDTHLKLMNDFAKDLKENC